MTETHALRYSGVAIVLHWTIAGLIILNLALGFSAAWTGDASLHRTLLSAHKPCGLAILSLSVLRILWRITHRPPEAPPVGSAWEASAKFIVHAGFYVLMLAVPLTGWLLSSAVPMRHPITIAGVLAVPFLPVSQSMVAAGRFHAGHEWLAIAMVALLALHVAAVAKHHLVYRDNLLRRMGIKRG